MGIWLIKSDIRVAFEHLFDPGVRNLNKLTFINLLKCPGGFPGRGDVELRIDYALIKSYIKLNIKLTCTIETRQIKLKLQELLWFSLC